MKIVNWIIQRLHPNMEYSRVSHKKDVFSGGGKGEQSSRVEVDTEALLSHRDDVSDVHHFLEGILTIGTFGHDSLNLQPYSNTEAHYYYYCDPLRPSKEAALAAEAYPMVERVKPLAVQCLGEETLVHTTQEMEVEDHVEPLLKEEKKDDRRERTTLADLFLTSDSSSTDEKAEPPAIHHPQINEEESSKTLPTTSQDSRSRDVRSLARKLMPWKKRAVNITTTTTTLITKMLKKKIHPELRGKLTNIVPDTRDGGEHLSQSAPMIW